jgi:methylated-DNA-protein-cysteine methyltransferase-like protein
MSMTAWQEQVWQWIAAVPRGKVASYGQIAALAGKPRHARHVGSVLRKLPAGTRLPWHRILLGNGALAFAPGSQAWRRQQSLLADEGIPLLQGRVHMPTHQWRP